MNFYKFPIKELAANEVFVFGTNADGFHGAGAAGWAMFGRFDNCWREMGLDKMPPGTKGFYAVKGRYLGMMDGTKGLGYGIQTVTRPGAQKSVSPQWIQEQIETLYDIAESHKEFKFMIAGGALHKTGFNGYSGHEIRTLYWSQSPPDNVYFPDLWDKP
jgi:hypothetical protein